MIPAVPVPQNAGIKTPVEIKLKPGWRYDSKQRAFVSESGERFKPADDLPQKSRLVYKTQELAKRDRSELSMNEKELVMYMQVILPEGESPANYVEAIRSWPSIAEASAGPEISLPGMG